jgi:S1-C subfamily serine protease
MSVLRQLWCLVFLALALLVCGPVGAQQDKKAKPEGGDGAAAKLNRFIQVQGVWAKDGYTVTAVKRDGPATQMKSADGKTVASLKPGDKIVEIEGTKIESPNDYAKAINTAKDAQKIEIKVRDRNSGKVDTWYVGSKESPFAK